MTAPWYPTSAPPVELDDSGAWARAGVTHWHLTRTEIAINAKDRFEAERWHQIRHAAGVEVAWSPVDALDWLVTERLKALVDVQDRIAVAKQAGWASEQDWADKAAMTWFMLTRVPDSPAGGGLAVSSGRSVELYANPMTAAMCSRHTR